MRNLGVLRSRVLLMKKTDISFYLKYNRIHVYVEVLRSIGCPGNVCFMIAENEKSLVLAPYPKRNLKSHRVPSAVYEGGKSMDICSMKMCKLLTDMCSWNTECSYRIPGTIFPGQKIAVFSLLEAEEIAQK